MTRTGRSRVLLVLLFFCSAVWVSNLAAADVRLRESGGFGLNADFHRVKDIAVDGSGNIYVLGLVTGGDGRVMVYGPGGTKKASFGEDHLYSSTHLALLRSGGVVVYDLVSRDSGNPRHYVDGGLRVFDVKGNFVKTIPLPADHQKVSEMAEAADGVIWTTYHRSNSDDTKILLWVDKIEVSSGRILATYGAGSFPNPRISALNTGFVPNMFAPVDHLVAAPNRTVVVGRSQNSKLLVYGSDGQVVGEILVPRSRTQLLPHDQRQEQVQMSQQFAKGHVHFTPETSKSTFVGLAIDGRGRLVIPSWDTNAEGLCLSEVYNLSGKRVETLTSPRTLSQAVKFSGDKAYDIVSDRGGSYRIVTYAVE